MSKLGDVFSKEVYRNLNVPLRGLGAPPPAARGYGGLGAEPPAAGRFFVIFWKKSCFNIIGLHFARIQSHLIVLDF